MTLKIALKIKMDTCQNLVLEWKILTPFSIEPNFTSYAAKYKHFILLNAIAWAHIAQGSKVVYKLQLLKYFEFNTVFLLIQESRPINYFPKKKLQN